MPHDVKTRWNSTFDMLNFAVEHIEAINTITGDRDMKLRQYELSEDDWDMVHQLRDILKVCGYIIQYNFDMFYSLWLIRSLRMPHYSFHEGHLASPLSYRQWTTSTNTLPPLLSATDTPLRSRPPLQLAKKPSTGTMTKPTIPKCSGSLWVWIT